MEVTIATETPEEDTAADQHMMTLPERDPSRAMALMKILESCEDTESVVGERSCGGSLDYSQFPSSFTRGKQYFEALQQGSIRTALSFDQPSLHNSITLLFPKKAFRRGTIT